LTDLARKIREGDLRALARGATAVENGAPEALVLLNELAPYAGHARIVGITGAPGAGKSTLVDALAAAIRARAKTAAILAVDPTSRATGGAILGDRIRMQQHHADPGIFIRSMATRGTTGGIARATAGLARLMDCAGRDYVLIETVGVGQDEIDIALLAQITVVVLVPGMGDDVQTIKAGVMEIADIFVINKSDHPGADRLQRELESMLLLGNGREPPILHTIATENQGIRELLDAIDRVATETPIPARGRLGGAATPVNAILRAVLPDLDRLGIAANGLHHVALLVSDVAAAAARLRASGANVTDPRPGPEGRYHVFVRPASGGLLLELIQESEPSES
jgi:LAO/AO transport system kinase